MLIETCQLTCRPEPGWHRRFWFSVGYGAFVVCVSGESGELPPPYTNDRCCDFVNPASARSPVLSTGVIPHFWLKTGKTGNSTCRIRSRESSAVPAGLLAAAPGRIDAHRRATPGGPNPARRQNRNLPGGSTRRRCSPPGNRARYPTCSPAGWRAAPEPPKPGIRAKKNQARRS